MSVTFFFLNQLTSFIRRGHNRSSAEKCKCKRMLVCFLGLPIEQKSENPSFGSDICLECFDAAVMADGLQGCPAA